MISRSHRKRRSFAERCLSSLVLCLAVVSVASVVADEGRIAFTSNRDGEWAIYIMDGDGENPHKLAIGSCPTWLPDGERISFLYESDLWETDLNGSHRKNLTEGRINLRSRISTSWSPDGSRVAYWGIADLVWGIYTMDPDGKNAQILARDATFKGTLSWSPDGKRIAFSVHRKLKPPFKGLGSDVFVMNSKGGGRRNLTLNSVARNIGGSWSPDGKKIAYVASPDPFQWLPPHNIHVMNSDGTDQVMPTDEGRWVYEEHPSWSPDSKKIAFVKQTPDGFHDIFTINADGSDLRNITQTHRISEGNPAWSPPSLAVSSTGRLVTRWGDVKQNAKLHRRGESED